MSNNIFKPNRPDGNQDKQQVPQQPPAASDINMELLDKLTGLLKGIETMNGKIADNYDIIDEMRSSLRKLRDQLQNIEVPEARLDDESQKILSSAPESITDEVEKKLSEKLGKFSEQLDNILKDAETSIKKAADGGTSGVTVAVNSAKTEISGFKSWCKQWLRYFVGSIIWAILASGMAVWQCSSANRARSEVEYELDSLRLNSDVYHDFINHSEKTGRTFDTWFESRVEVYKNRIHHRDSLRKEK